MPKLIEDDDTRKRLSRRLGREVTGPIYDNAEEANEASRRLIEKIKKESKGKKRVVMPVGILVEKPETNGDSKC